MLHNAEHMRKVEYSVCCSVKLAAADAVVSFCPASRLYSVKPEVSRECPVLCVCVCVFFNLCRSLKEFPNFHMSYNDE